VVLLQTRWLGKKGCKRWMTAVVLLAPMSAGNVDL
jgi:hypothetical protein